MATPQEFQALGRYSTATIHEACPGSRVLPCRVRPAWPGARVIGPGFPVDQPAGSNERLHEAIYCAPPGSVIVAATGDEAYGYWGDLMSRAAVARGLAGVVLLGGIRDLDAIEALVFPVFASAVCVRGTRKRHGVTEPAGSVLFDDVKIRRGDLVVGDREGVVVLPGVPGEVARDTIVRAEAREAREAAFRDRLDRGERLLDLIRSGSASGDSGANA